MLAAAIHAGAGFIVTFNLSDFPAAFLTPFHIEAIHPDGFVCRLWDEDPDAVLEAVRLQRAGLKKNPPKSADEYLETLERCPALSDGRVAQDLHGPDLTMWAALRIRGFDARFVTRAKGSVRGTASARPLRDADRRCR